MTIPYPPPFRFRTIFISDIHLGTKPSQTTALLEFLRMTECEKLYLVGDIIDNWALRRSWYWDQTHNDVIQKLLRKARKGTQIVYIPGNHDEKFRDFAGTHFGRVRVRLEDLHKAADGKTYLVLHGDKFDGVVLYANWLAHLGDRAYGLAIVLNHRFNQIRRILKLPYWSLSAFLKRRVKRALEFVNHFEEAVVREARRVGTDGVICGHIHTPEIRDIDGITYCNDGDWVESCSALVEHMDGRMEIIDWSSYRTLLTEQNHARVDRDRRLASAG